MKTYRPGFDLVTVIHNEKNAALARELWTAVAVHADAEHSVFTSDNRTFNRGFGKACNDAVDMFPVPRKIIGFLNPDAIVRAPFMGIVQSAFDTFPNAVIAGNRFGKPKHELDGWGLRQWVCGAALFVRREWFIRVGRFDERFWLFFEETDLCKRAEEQEKIILDLNLPIEHNSPTDDSPEDVELKNKWMNEGWRRYRHKWQL